MDKYEKICVEKNPDFSVYHGAGKYFSSKENTLLHCDTNLSISYMLQCSGNIKIEGKQYPIQNGDVIITTPTEIHCCSIDDGTYHERISVCINKSILNNFHFKSEDFINLFVQHKNGIGNIIPSDTATEFELGSLVSKILMLSKYKSNKNNILCVCKIMELLDKVNDAVCQHEQKPTSHTTNNTTISEAIKYINKNFTTNINCLELAQKLFVNKYHLEHLFKESVGMPLWEYVIIKRLLYVNELLQQKYSVETASHEAGFNNYSNFYRLYKKHFNCTPMEYKRTANSENAHL